MGKFWKGKNWEALDTTSDGKHLVLGYDDKAGSSLLVLMPNPFK